jgi:hypothetical protein
MQNVKASSHAAVPHQPLASAAAGALRKMVCEMHRSAHQACDRPRVPCAFGSWLSLELSACFRVVGGGRYRTRAYAGYLRAIYGIRLSRNARNWRAANARNRLVADSKRKAVRHRRQATIPTTEAVPTTSVIAISVGKKCPVTIRAQPRRNNQMAVMIAIQKIRQGSAAHFASSLFWNPATIANQSGRVCTS